MLRKADIVGISLGAAGLVAVFSGKDPQSSLVITGIVLLCLSAAVFVFTARRCRWRQISLVVIYTAISAASFVLTFKHDAFGIFDPVYLVYGLLLLPLVAIIAGIALDCGSLKHRVLKNITYTSSIIAITICHFVLVAIAASGV